MAWYLKAPGETLLYEDYVSERCLFFLLVQHYFCSRLSRIAKDVMDSRFGNFLQSLGSAAYFLSAGVISP